MKKVNLTSSIKFKLLFPIVIGIFIVSSLGLYSLYQMQMKELYDKLQTQNLSMVANLGQSAHESIAKGQRTSFQKILDNFATIKGVKTAYLYNTGGFATYLSGYKTVGLPFVRQNGGVYNPNQTLFDQTNGNFMRDDWSYHNVNESDRSKKHREEMMANGKDCKSCHITIDTNNYQNFQIKDSISKAVLPIAAEQNCITCHTNWQIGDIAGYIGIDVDNSQDIQTLQNSMVNFGYVLAIISFVIIVIVLIIARLTLKPLDAFQTGLYDFFKFLNYEISDVAPINIKSNDEIGVMAKAVNHHIVHSVEKTKAIMEQDDQVIKEIVNIVDDISKGNLKGHIHKTSDNPTTRELVVVINKLIDSLKSTIDKSLEVLVSYQNDDFRSRINNTYQGEMAKLIDGINSLGASITEMLTYNQSIAMKLDNNATNLLKNVEVLNESTTATATSLEQTAAAIEEISSNMTQTTSHIVSMANDAKDLSKVAEDGKELASQTTTSMTLIDEQVRSISDAIGVIDQIAFQTNILSLNAAVEAATAGESGKGFAVVAGEVRNLANRSSEAAKEIKELVTQASQKANDGKEIADEMIEGYTLLNNSLNHTLTIINNVEMASKEQEIGISQINETVTVIDQQTGHNVSIASNAADAAQETKEMAQEILEEINRTKF